jgi:arginyl-tRNA synthetase
MRDRLVQCLSDALGRVFNLSEGEIPAFNFEVPSAEDHGDFATNAAMLLAKKLRRPPREIAKILSEEFLREELVEKVDVAGPGFVNVFIKASAWREVLVKILSQGDAYGKRLEKNPEKVMVEFVSANPTGPLHFGHGRGAVVGDVLANLLSHTGCDVQREFYVNDAGVQVKALALSVVHRLKELRGIGSILPENGYKGGYVLDIARDLPAELAAFLPGDPSEEDLARITGHCITKMLEDIRTDLDAFGVRMDVFTSERALVKSGRIQEAFSELTDRGVLEEREGARWFLSDRFGDEKPRVLVKSDGSHTYFATDVAYHLDKLRRGFVRMINVWGADHHGYVPRMKAALSALGHPPEKLEVVLVQMVSLVRDGQPVILSKREGEIVTLREVIEEVGPDAARFFFVLRGVDSQMEFDLELAKKHSLDNPVFYVQYGHARLSSLLAKAAERGIEVPKPDAIGKVDLKPLELPEELRLIKKMASFGDVVARCAESRAPHLLVYYIQDLVGGFHQYYTTYGKKSPVLGGPPERIAARLVFVQALRQVIRCALRLLGVSAPDRMETLLEEVGREDP